jgi:hypothetical protein
MQEHAGVLARWRGGSIDSLAGEDLEAMMRQQRRLVAGAAHAFWLQARALCLKTLVAVLVAKEGPMTPLVRKTLRGEGWGGVSGR